MTLTLNIRGIAAGGDGVARADDGLVVFVPRAAPGDVVDVELVQRKTSYARGRIVSVIESGPSRVEPACAHYRDDECGGCQLQHVSPETQLAAKRAIVGEALRRVGRQQIEDPTIVPADEPWHYRSKVTLAVGDGQIGFHRYDRPGAIFALRDCPIARPRVMALWTAVRARRDLLPTQLTSLVVREDRSGGMHVVAVGGDVTWDARRLAAAVAEPNVSYWWKPTRGAARVIAGPRTGFPAVAFEQSNRRLAERIRRDTVESLGDLDGSVVWDLYGGVGDTAELLASRGAVVWSVDADRSAVEWGRRAQWGDRSGPAVERVAGRAEEVLARLPVPDAVVVNPPRTGLAKQVTHWLGSWLAGRSGRRLAYVSCDPATLARDLSRIAAGRVCSLTAYDLFPQTAHVEALVLVEAA